MCCSIVHLIGSLFGSWFQTSCIYPLFEVMTPNGSYLSVGVILYQNLPNSFGSCHMRFHLKFFATYSRNHLFHMLLTSKPANLTAGIFQEMLPSQVLFFAFGPVLLQTVGASGGSVRCPLSVAWLSCFRPKTLRPFFMVV